MHFHLATPPRSTPKKSYDKTSNGVFIFIQRCALAPCRTHPLHSENKVRHRRRRFLSRASLVLREVRWKVERGPARSSRETKRSPPEPGTSMYYDDRMIVLGCFLPSRLFFADCPPSTGLKTNARPRFHRPLSELHISSPTTKTTLKGGHKPGGRRDDT